MILIDTNFLSKIRRHSEGATFREYLGRHKVLPPNGNGNFVLTPTLIIEYAGHIPSRELPTFAHPRSGAAQDMGDWVEQCWRQSEQKYSKRKLKKLYRSSIKTLRRKRDECGRSFISREHMKAVLRKWRRDEKTFCAMLSYLLIGNSLMTFDHLPTNKKDAHWHMLHELVHLWNNGVSIPLLKLAHRMLAHLISMAEESGEVPTGPGWPSAEVIGHIKALDLGDADYLTFAVLGVPTGTGLVAVDVFTSDPRDRCIELLKLCKEIFRALSERLSELGDKNPIKFVPTPGRVHFYCKDSRRYLAPVDVSAL